MSALECPTQQYEACEEFGFDPELTYKKYKQTGMIHSLVFFLLAHATLMSSYIPPLIATLSYIYGDVWEGDQIKLPDKLPYHCWMPFPYNTGETFLIALGYQSIPMFSYAYR